MPNLFSERLGFEGTQMKRQYLHLSVYRCDKCEGPFVTASLAVRENEISKETDIRGVGAICLSCGGRQTAPPGNGPARQFPPVEWETVSRKEEPALAATFS